MLSSDSPTPPDVRMPPSTLVVGRYRIVAFVGKGGMGAVYRAHDEHLNRDVALKCVFASGTASLRAAAIREAKMLATLNHPNVLHVFDAVLDGDAVWIVSEWLEGLTLTQVRAKALGPASTGVCIAQVFEALAAIHTQGIVHRDVKPSNIMITRAGRVKLIDFGVAFHPEMSTGETIAGSLRYTDPKILAGDLPDFDSDLYAAALVLLELLSGQEVWPVLAPLPLYRMIRTDAQRRLSVLSHGVHPVLAGLAQQLVIQALKETEGERRSAASAATTVRAWLRQVLPGSADDYLANTLFATSTVPNPDERSTNQAEVAARLADPHLSGREKCAWLAFADALDMDIASMPLATAQASSSNNRLAAKLATKGASWVAAMLLALLPLQRTPRAGAKGVASLATSTVLPATATPPPPPANGAMSLQLTPISTPPPTPSPNEPREAAPKPAAESSAAIEIVTNAWADLLVDGRSAGRVPRARPFVLPFGHHHLVFRSPFVRTLATTLDVDQTTPKRLTYKLAELTRKIHLVLAKRGVLALDGVRLGSASETTLRLRLGEQSRPHYPRGRARNDRDAPDRFKYAQRGAFAMTRQAAVWELLGFTNDGALAARLPVAAPVTCLSGMDGEGDLHVPELGQTTIFVRAADDEISLLVPDARGRTQVVALKPGLPRRIGTLSWLLLLVAQTSSADHAALTGAAAHDWLFDWMTAPLGGRRELESALQSFLGLLARHAGARNGMLLLFDGEAARLVSWQGMTAQDAETLWHKLPPSILGDILRRQARMILPDDTNLPATQSTIFIRGVRSVAGFPVAVEGRVLALLILGFRNLVSELTEEVQKLIELAAAVGGLVIQRALLREQLETRVLQANKAPAGPARLMVGHSRALDLVYHHLHKLAPTRIPVLVLGETGTGKELAARELHRLSSRGDKSFVAINAAALPENLIEAELFGHKRGAFTGALADRAGLIEKAAGGTLFIDEVGELALTLQAKLLRVLQERAVHRLGEDHARPVDFRVVAATHCSLRDMVNAKTFREDLYYRLAGAEIKLPPLRDRREDIPELANLFKARSITAHGLPNRDWSQEALRALVNAPWPGNVRQLQHTCERATIMAEGPVIDAADLDISVIEGASVDLLTTDMPNEGPLAQVKDDWLRMHLSRTLAKHAWNKKATAQHLGIGLRTLFRYIEQLDIRGGDDDEQTPSF